MKMQWLLALLALGLASISGCAPLAPTAIIPVSGQRANASSSIKVTEVALVEQSTDNPTHIAFQDRVAQAMAARQAGWHLPGPQEALNEADQILAPFGYRLTINPNPPFSSYALYHNSQLIQADITRFWPVSVKNGGGDFLFSYQTGAGEQWVASREGLKNWPYLGKNTPPVYYGSEIAYAETGAGEINVYAGGGMLYTGQSSPNKGVNAQVREFVTWSSSGGVGTAVDHWALEVDHNIILDSQDLVKSKGYQEAFNLFILNGQPLYFYVKNGLTYINYAGKDSPYTYDKVVYGNEGATAIFNPGGNAGTVWFYALRDGVWYYVEAGLNK